MFSNKSTIAAAEQVPNVINDKEVLSGQEIDLQVHVEKLALQIIKNSYCWKS